MDSLFPKQYETYGKTVSVLRNHNMEGNDQGLLLKEITSFLDKNNIPYMITGAWSVIFYGRPRASHDIDFVVEVNKDAIQRVINAFEKLSDEYIVQPFQIKEAVTGKTMFNLLHTETGLKLDFWILDDNEFNRVRFSRRKRVKILHQYMHVATAEDTILQKLLWYNASQIEKHLVDAAFVYQIQREYLDTNYLHKWAKRHKTTALLSELANIDLEKYL